MLLYLRLRGNILARSLKTYGLMLLFFLSLSAIYMNHCSHPMAFYLWNCLDATIVFALVALMNGLLYPFLFKTDLSANAA